MNIKPIMKNAQSDGEPDAVNSIEFYPAERVREIFARLAGARGTPQEAAELRIFAKRMEYLYKKQSGETVYYLDNEELIRKLTPENKCKILSFEYRKKYLISPHLASGYKPPEKPQGECKLDFIWNHLEARQ